MSEIYTQDVSRCMAEVIGDGGLTADALATARAAAWDVWSAMREDIAEEGFPALSIAAQADDLGAIWDAAAPATPAAPSRWRHRNGPTSWRAGRSAPRRRPAVSSRPPSPPSWPSEP